MPRSCRRRRANIPQIRTFNQAKDLFDSDVDAVAIATSISTHYDLARQALLQRANTFSSKSRSTDNSEKALELAAMAKKSGPYPDDRPHLYLQPAGGAGSRT